jgi:two-component system, NtrC family, sensor kinase
MPPAVWPHPPELRDFPSYLPYTIRVPSGPHPATERRKLPLREASLVQALTMTDRLHELLPVLHYHAVSGVGGHGSILCQFNRAGDWLHPTSGFGIDDLPAGPWPGESAPQALFRGGGPVFVTDLDRTFPGITEYLESGSAVLVPLAQMQDPVGVLIVGCVAAPSAEQMAAIASVGYAFTLALERTRLAYEADLQRDLRELLQQFSRSVSSSLTLAPGLEALCAGINTLFTAHRTSVWLHDRRARTVVLSASSDVVYLAQEHRTSTEDTRAPAAAALRQERAELARNGSGATGMLTIPLRGRRRALGTLVLEDVRLESGGGLAVLDRADELGRQLAVAIENVLLLEDVLRARRQLENTFNSLTDLVAVCDAEGRLVYMNRAFLNRTGRPRQELIDRPLADIVGPGLRALLEKRGEETPAPLSAEVQDPGLNGTFLVTVTPLLGDEHESTGAVLVARDVTPHARLEAERVELRNRLVQSEKLAALGQFVAGIAHELNNPLQGVLGHLELLRTTGAFPKALRRDIQIVYREADRAAKIVRNLLVFAGSRRLVRRRTSVNATLSRVLALRGPALRKAGIEVARRHDEGLPRVLADPLLLQQALLNIVLNAEQAIGEAGGRIETSTTLIEHKDGKRIGIDIRDTGPGISAAALTRLFEPFFTTKEVGKGTGLGLAITYGIIQEHGGEIVVSNHPDGGAVFSVRLPVETG